MLSESIAALNSYRKTLSCGLVSSTSETKEEAIISECLVRLGALSWQRKRHGAPALRRTWFFTGKWLLDDSPSPSLSHLLDSTACMTACMAAHAAAFALFYPLPTQASAGHLQG